MRGGPSWGALGVKQVAFVDMLEVRKSMREKERKLQSQIRNGQKSRSRDSGAKSLGVVKAKRRNMDKIYDTDRGIGDVTAWVSPWLAVVSDCQAARGGLLWMAVGKGHPCNCGLARLPFLAMAHALVQLPIKGNTHDIIFRFIFCSYTHNDTSESGSRQSQLSHTNRSPQKHPKAVQKQASSLNHFSLQEADSFNHHVLTLAPLQALH